METSYTFDLANGPTMTTEYHYSRFGQERVGAGPSREWPGSEYGSAPASQLVQLNVDY